MKRINLIKALLLFVSFTYGFNGLSQSIEKEGDLSHIVFHLDSLGNLIDHKQALKLMQTGKYISIPKLNEQNDIEYLIRKSDPNNPFDKKHQVYTDGKMVVNTQGMPSFKPKLAMGEKIPEICADGFSETLCLGNGVIREESTLLIYTSKKLWSTIKGGMSSLIKAHPEVNFIIIQSDEKRKLQEFFSKAFLKKRANVYLAKDLKDVFLLKNESSTIYHLVNQSGEISVLIPPMPNPDIANKALSKYLTHQAKKSSTKQ